MKLHLSQDEVRDILCSSAKAINDKYHTYNTIEPTADGGFTLLYIAPPTSAPVKKQSRWRFWGRSTQPELKPAPGSVEAQAICEAMRDETRAATAAVGEPEVVGTTLGSEAARRDAVLTFAEAVEGLNRFKLDQRRVG